MANAIYIRYKFCSGCHSCEVACRNELGLELGQFGMKVLEDEPRQNPDGSWHWDYIAYPTELCNMCEERVARGELPSCVQCCQAKVLKYGTVQECAQMVEDAGEKAALFVK